jgi:adenylate kinase family enzyme
MIQSFRRILIIGTTGSGKTTLARTLSRIGGVRHIELDMLMYRDNWKAIPVEHFVEQVAAIAESDSWLIDGNYASVRRLTWERADLVVWLDYPLGIILGRLLKRSFLRLLRSSDLGNNNREQFRRLFGRRSIVLWAIRSHGPLRKEYEIAVTSKRSNSPCIIRLRSPRRTRIWLSRISGVVSNAGPSEWDGAVGIRWSSSDDHTSNL